MGAVAEAHLPETALSGGIHVCALVPMLFKTLARCGVQVAEITKSSLISLLWSL
jgi:hypothetical protein